MQLTSRNIQFFHFSPTPTVYWTRDNFTSLPSKVIQRSWGQELLIPNADQSDAGTYECIGVNSETDLPVIRQVNLLLQCKCFERLRQILHIKCLFEVIHFQFQLSTSE